MPWIKDGNGVGEDKYVVSKYYGKDDLPTWDQIYNEFWIPETFGYDPDDPEQNLEGVPESSQPTELIKRMDLYWKLPHRKVLLMWICNQFNKMLFEDENRTRMLDFMKLPGVSLFDDIRFWIVEIKEDDRQIYDLSVIETDGIMLGSDSPPPTLTLNRPNGTVDPFAPKCPRVNINVFSRKFDLVIVLRGLEQDIPFFILNSSNPRYRPIISELLAEVRDYFEGDQVGWKNFDGSALPSQAPLKRGCDDSGVDPAL